MYRHGLPSISADSATHRTAHKTWSFQPVTLACTCSARPQTYFLNRMQQQDPDITLLDPKLMYYKHWGANIYKNVKCTNSWGPSSQHSSQIVALVQTTSIYLWFLVVLCYFLKICFLMPIVTTWLATGVAEKVCNQSNLPPNQPIYSSIYTSC